MATVAYTIVPPPSSGGQTVSEFPDGVRVVTWGPMANTDIGTPYAAPHRSDKSVQATGTFGVGGTVTIEGSNNPDSATAAFSTLHDPSVTTALTLVSGAATSLKQVLENTWFIRPNITGGDGTTSVTVRMLIQTVARR